MVVIFTCATYRAVHFELVTSLSLEVFVKALRRFIARRGRINTFISDNGTNFHGTANLMSQLDPDELLQAASVHKFSWHFNPPTAPWWGGFWERIIRVLKDLLKRNLRRASLNYEELLTILKIVNQLSMLDPLLISRRILMIFDRLLHPCFYKI